jgi:hypothetical protein
VAVTSHGRRALQIDPEIRDARRVSASKAHARSRPFEGLAEFGRRRVKFDRRLQPLNFAELSRMEVYDILPDPPRTADGSCFAFILGMNDRKAQLSLRLLGFFFDREPDNPKVSVIC